jgi:hypothetical protein
MNQCSWWLPIVLGLLPACPSPTRHLCLEQASCAGQDEPETFCAELDEDLTRSQRRLRDACRSEDDALATCVIRRGACRGGVFAEEAPDDCADERGDALDCAADFGE